MCAIYFHKGFHIFTKVDSAKEEIRKAQTNKEMIVAVFLFLISKRHDDMLWKELILIKRN